MIHKELDVFRDIIFYEEPHKYMRGDKQLISCTTKLKDYIKPFNTRYWSTYKALQRTGHSVKKYLEKDGLILIDGQISNIDEVDWSYLTITPEDVEQEWEYAATLGKLRGTLVHKYIEQRMYGKVTMEEPDLSSVKTEDREEFKIILGNLYVMATQFIRNNPYLIPVRSEIVVGDNESGIGGMVDQLFYNTIDEEYQLWDWKTDKKIDRINTWDSFLSPFEMLDDCAFNKYSMQLSIYKHIIQENTNIVLGKSHVTWFNIKNDDYVIIPLTDFTKLTIFKTIFK